MRPPSDGGLKRHNQIVNCNNKIQVKHEILRDNKCGMCGKVLSKQIKLKKHMEISHDNKCDHCEKAFPFLGMLKTHIWTVHKGHKEKTCNLCGKSLSKQIKLEKHLEILHDHKCENCKKSFPSVQKLKEHNLEIHKSEKKLIKCDVCYKFFVHKSALKNHILVDHLFNLQKHLEISQDHKSDDGEKSFPIAQTLNKHTERQSEKELIKCDLCGKVFRRSSLKNQKSALKNHIMVEHPINLFALKQKFQNVSIEKVKLEKIDIKEELVHSFEN